MIYTYLIKYKGIYSVLKIDLRKGLFVSAYLMAQKL